MADNVPITAGSGTNVATDDIGGVHFQRAKVALGPNGTHTADQAGRDLGSGDGAAYVDLRPSVSRIPQTPTVSTSPAYSVKDAIGGLLTFANAARAAGGSLLVMSAQLVDKAQQMKEIDLVLFTDSVAAPTDNAVFDPTDTELLTCCGVITFSTADYRDFNDNSVATRDVAIEASLVGTSLYGVLVSRSATGPTFASTSDVVVALTVQRD